MKRSLLLLATASLALSALQGAAPEPKPNVLIILADDMGYSDLGCYGSEIATPNLDRLAQDGLRFTQFYNTARCWPTRAGRLAESLPSSARWAPWKTRSCFSSPTTARARK